MKKKKIIKISVLLLSITVLLWWFWYELTWEGKRNLGDLSHHCNMDYKINIIHSSEFDWAQPLYFNIKKNDTILGNYGGQFEITDNMGEKLKSFEIHCYDSILYVTWKNGNIPLIIFDTKTQRLYPHIYEKESYRKDKYKTALFNEIKKGNPKLEYE